jgi:hypothetical protein
MAPLPQPVQLRWMLSAPAYGLPPVSVDQEKGIIFGAAVCSEGEARGHGVMLDAEFIGTVVREGNAKKSGIKCRFGHPNMSSEALGTFLGRAKNFRSEVVGGRAVARADVFTSAEASDTPQGDLRGYVLRMAANEPDAFGMSIVFEPGDSYQKAGPDGKVPQESPWYAKLEKLLAADMVDDPAANPDGLFSAWASETFAGQVTEFLDTHPDLFALVEQHPEALEGFMARYRAYLQRKGKVMDKPKNEPAAVAAESSPEPAPAAEQPNEPAAAAPEKPADQKVDGLSSAGAAQPTADPARAELKRFMAAFGSEGAAYFADGKSFEDAQTLALSAARTQIEALEAETKDLRDKLALARGEEPVAMSGHTPPSGEGDEATELERLTKAFGGDKAAAERVLAERRKRRAAGKPAGKAPAEA